jgi:hypothetical protein
VLRLGDQGTETAAATGFAKQPEHPAARPTGTRDHRYRSYPTVLSLLRTFNANVRTQWPMRLNQRCHATAAAYAPLAPHFRPV